MSAMLTSREWLESVQEVQQSARWEWLRAITEAAQAQFMYRSMAIWCSTLEIDSIQKLQARQKELQEQDFWHTALGVTRERLASAIEEAGSTRATPRAKVEPPAAQQQQERRRQAATTAMERGPLTSPPPATVYPVRP